MILRAVSALIPVRPDLRRVVGWQLCGGPSITGPWRSANANAIGDDHTAPDVLMAANFLESETHVRVTFIAEGGTWKGGRTSLPPAPLAPEGDVTEVLRAPRKGVAGVIAR